MTDKVIAFPTPIPTRKYQVRFAGPVVIKARDYEDVMRALDRAGIECADIEITPL